VTSQTTSNLRIGIGFGAFLATCCTGWALFASLVQGSADIRLRHGSVIALETLLAAYWAGGLLCGLVVGLLLPLARSHVGAVIGGALAMLPLYGAMYVSQYGFEVPEPGMSLGLVLASMIVGGGAAHVLFKQHEAERSGTAGEA
jgi:hypothetical protein